MMYPGTYINDMHLLGMALQEPASPTEPMIIQFLIYMYEHENLKDPDDFEHTCVYLIRIFRCICLYVIEKRGMTGPELETFTDELRREGGERLTLDRTRECS
jgi:hypothetical protein